MKRAATLFFFFAALTFPALAQVEADKVTVLKGTLVMVLGSEGQTMTMLRLANGSLVAIDMPEGEIARLQLRERDRIKVSGVFIGAVAGEQTQALILARTMVRKGKTLTIENPIQITERDRLQIRAYEEERLRIKDQARVQTGTKSSAGESGAKSSGKK
jgi:hypothetical protein